MSRLRWEFRPMAALAGPVVLAEIGWISMGIVDIMMVGRLGASAIGGISIGVAVFFTVAFFGMGLLLGLDTLVSQAFGARRLAECHRWLAHGVALAVLLTIPLTLVIAVARHLLPHWGIRAEVLREAVPYLDALTWSLLPLLLYSTLRRYLQAMGRTKPVTFALISANLVNAGSNWTLIYGHLGAPALGAEGAGWSALISRFYMAAVLLSAILSGDGRQQVGLADVPLRIEFGRLRELVRLGLPAAGQITLEMGAFATVTMLAGRLTVPELAAHQIALSVATFTFMVSTGISVAGAVRVGHAIGRRDAAGAEAAGWTALLLGAGFMALAGAVMLLFPRIILRIFTTDSTVTATGASLLVLAALFQLFDGTQVVATGILRGAGDTRTPMLTNLLAHWFLGLPVGFGLGFGLGLGIFGLWIGLSIGLIAVGVVLLQAWSRRVARLDRMAGPQPIPATTLQGNSPTRNPRVGGPVGG